MNVLLLKLMNLRRLKWKWESNPLKIYSIIWRFFKIFLDFYFTLKHKKD